MKKNDLLGLLICLLWLGGLSAGPALAQPLQIAVLESRALPVYENVLQQIRRDLPAVTFLVYDLAGQRETGEKALTEVRKKNVNLILTFGTLAATIAKDQEKNTPIVFTFVLNPAAAGLLPEPGAAKGNLTGVALDIPVTDQFAYFRLVVPRLRSIGVFYNQQESGAVIAEARIAARDMGLTLKAIPITTPEEVPSKLNLLAGVDGLWMVADSLVFTPRNTEYILLYTLKEDLPFMGVSEQFVKAGALCSVSPDYDALTRQTSGQIAAILRGVQPANLPVELPQRIELALNLKAAESIGLKLSPEIIRQADKTY